MSAHYVRDADAQEWVGRLARDVGVDPARLQEAMEMFLSRQRRLPAIVGATRAAEILGVQLPHLARFRDQGRMPEPVAVEGTYDAYLKDEIEAFAAELAAEREARQKRREELAAKETG